MKRCLFCIRRKSDSGHAFWNQFHCEALHLVYFLVVASPTALLISAV
jgi:hypothetical protein